MGLAEKLFGPRFGTVKGPPPGVSWTLLRAGAWRLVETTMGLAVAVTCPLCGRYDMVFFRIGS